MASSLKILYYSDACNTGGAEAYLTTLARAAKQDYAVEVAMTDAAALNGLSRSLQDLDISVHRLPAIPSLRNPLPFLKHFGFFLAHRFNLVHFNQIDPWSCAPGILAARFSGLKNLMATTHLPNTVYEVPAPFRARLAPHLLKRIILVGTCHLGPSARNDSRPHSRVQVVVNGIPLPDPVTPENRIATRQELGLSPEVPIIGTVGRLTRQKDHKTLMKAAARVPGAHFAIIGEGPEHDDLLRLRDSLGLRERFHLLGSRPQASRLLGAFDIFVLSSRYEGLPLALLEAMGAGLPVVASDLPETREVIRPEQDGLLAAPASSLALAEALNILLENVQKRNAMGRSGRERVETDFSETRMIRETFMIYREMLGERHRGVPG